MAESFISEVTLDDLMNSVFRAIDAGGTNVRPTKGANRELRGVLLELTNPRARLSRTETRGKPFSCLGELCWYLSGSGDLEFIKYYIPAYRLGADAGVLHGAYGPRLAGDEDQLGQVAGLLSRKPASRQAVVQLFRASDVRSGQKDVPCTCTLQFLLRQEKLDLVVNMRSNDAYKGLPHDIFCFTMIQELLARQLSAELGTYKHMVGSLHRYDKDADSAQQFLREGFQPTAIMMPPMPLGDPRPSLQALLELERSIRLDPEPARALTSLDPYWSDLARLLAVFRYHKDNNPEGILRVMGTLVNRAYKPFVAKKYDELRTYG